MKAASRLSAGKDPKPQSEPLQRPAGPAVRIHPFVLILFAGLIAFFGCLRADFYMDDFGFILHSNKNEPAPRRYELPLIPSFTTGEPGPDMLGVTIFQIVPTSFFVLTEHLVPKVSEASWLYHLWNLLFHLGTACFAFKAGREVLNLAGLLRNDQERSTAASIGAILFACHPLCSEPLNYAKCLNSVTVAMFAMMAVFGTARWLREGGRKSLWLAFGGLAGATLSYFPGLTLTMVWLAVLVVFRLFTPAAAAPVGESGEAGSDWLGQHKAIILAALAAGGVLLVIVMLPHIKNQFNYWGPLIPAHLFTQGRLLWSYLGKAVVPTGLCSDHYIPWSVPGHDGIAMAGLAAGGIIVFICAGLITGLIPTRHRMALRGWALLILLALLPLLIRFGYVNAEHFVEYRAYPSVPWLMLMLGTGLVAVGSRFPALQRLPLFAGAAVAVVWILLSIQRNQTWHSREDLARDVLQKYPLNDRAMTQLQDAGLDTGNLQEIKDLHLRVLSLEGEYGSYNAGHTDRRLSTSRLSDSVLRSYQFMVWATAYTEGSAKALEWADHVIETLRARMPEKFASDKREGVVKAWPLLSARDTVAAHRAEIDAAVKERAARAAAGNPL
jgi:hypothetical protein